MAALSHFDADRYLERPAKDHYIFLIFGADQGLVSERSRKLIQFFLGSERDTREAVELAGDIVAADPLTLVDEANSIDMFGGPRRVIRINVGAKSILPALDLIAQAPPANCAIILQSGEIRRDAPLRKWIERQAFSVSIECRADDSRDLQRLIDAELKGANLSIDPDARDALGAMLGEDRLSTRSELTKLFFYVRGQQSVTLEHVHAILHDASALGIDAATIALFSGQSVRAMEHLNKALQLGVDANMIFGATLRYAMAAHRSRAEIEQGANFDDALQTLLRQVNGYGRKSEIAEHLRRISAMRWQAAIEAISDGLSRLRKDNVLSEERITRIFLNLTMSQRH